MVVDMGDNLKCHEPGCVVPRSVLMYCCIKKTYRMEIRVPMEFESNPNNRIPIISTSIEKVVLFGHETGIPRGRLTWQNY